MIKKNYTGNARRARNIIWNAAGRYDFDPPFIAFYANGVPDQYFNMIAGLVDKWLDMDRIMAFFSEYESSRRADEFDDLLWLGLENCMYEKEVTERPVMEDLRRERAEEFFIEQQSLSVQQMEYQSVPVYNQQEYRWAGIAGKRLPMLSAREKKLAEALRFSGDLDTDGVIGAMKDVLADFFRYTPGQTRENSAGRGLMNRRFRTGGHRQVDKLLVRAGTGMGDHEKAKQQRHEGLGRRSGPGEADETYVRDVFGMPMLTDSEMSILESDVCTGADRGCRLWVTGGEMTATDDKDALEVRRSAGRQKALNERFRTENAASIEGAVKSLSSTIDTVFASYFKHMPEPARAGRIRAGEAYRLPVLGDDKVFLRDSEENEPDICVDLLLDASQSRMNYQEVLAAESVIIAKSLERVKVPVRVHTFRSLRGYTVLERLKGWDDHSPDGLMRYYAGGWNRDGLAIKALEHLDDDPVLNGRKRLILVLTDAAPNDSAPILPDAAPDDAASILSGRARKGREYEGAAAVRATQEAVRELRARGVKIGAVFHGNTHNLDNVQQIFGHAYVRILKAGQLAQGVSDLLLMLLREDTYTESAR